MHMSREVMSSTVSIHFHPPSGMEKLMEIGWKLLCRHKCTTEHSVKHLLPHGLHHLLHCLLSLQSDSMNSAKCGRRQRQRTVLRPTTDRRTCVLRSTTDGRFWGRGSLHQRGRQIRGNSSNWGVGDPHLWLQWGQQQVIQRVLLQLHPREQMQHHQVG